MKIGVFSLIDVDINSYLKLISKVLKIGLKYLNISHVEFNVIIVDNSYIHNLNKEYRGIDKETDVITFALEDDKTFNPKKRVLGDIYISFDKAKSQALEYNHSLERELSFLSVHGLLHLLGYDHMNSSDEKIMFNLQDKILNKAKIDR